MVDRQQTSDNRHHLFLIIAVCCLLFAVFIVASWASKTKSLLQVTLGNKTTISVVIADTEQKRTQGYSDHQPITDTEGMLFTFSYPVSETFWMNKMLFDLDFIYIQNNKVVYLVEHVKAPINNDGQMEYINSPVLFDAVLEVKSGFIKRHSIRVGDSIKIRN